MYEIEAGEVSEDFARCWQAAGRHLQQRGQGALGWLRADLHPPFLEHLSFRMGNQLFFVRIEDVEGRIAGPGSLAGLLSIADGCKGHPCVMPMRAHGGDWSADWPEWGLVHARTGRPIEPPVLVTDALIEMTDWELQDFAIQPVRRHLEKQGRQVMSCQGSPHVDPSIWFVGDEGPEWVVVRAVRYPTLQADPPADWAAIAQSCARLSRRGSFASVSVASADDEFDPQRHPVVPLWRGHAMIIRFTGLQRVQ